MNFEGAKENIQPLATGRNVERLEVAINAESHPEYQQELNHQQKQFEQSIADYKGDDPLDLWFEYVSWIEQSYPSGKESALQALLTKCLSKFERDDRYTQDPRLVRLFIKYIDSQKEPQQYYQKMYNKGIGTMVADLYIAWAHYYDIVDNYDLAEQVYQKGIAARATPIDQLKQAFERFHFSISQRVLEKDGYRQEFVTSMQERRNAFTSLRSYKSSMVGSIRTGSAVKSYEPGRVKQNPSLPKSSKNVLINVYEGSSNATASNPQNPSTSVVEDIQNSMMENKIEPGPWSKASKSKRKSVFRHKSGQESILSFAILEDCEHSTIQEFAALPPDNNDYGILLPQNFAHRSDRQKEMNVPLYIEEIREPNVLPCYDFIMVHPNKEQSFSLEELKAYRYFKKMNISNNFTKTQEKIWGIGSKLPMRRPPTFAEKNQPQTDFNCERPDITAIPLTELFCCKLSLFYPVDSTEEVSFEELMKMKRQQQSEDAHVDEVMMDETVCVRGRQSFGVQYTRRSIFPYGRKSIIPVSPDINYAVDMDIDIVDKEIHGEVKQHETNENLVELCVFQDDQSQNATPVVSTIKDTYKVGKLKENLSVLEIPNTEVDSNSGVPATALTIQDKCDFPVNKPKHVFAIPNADLFSLDINRDREVKDAAPTVGLTMKVECEIPVNKAKHVFAVPQCKALAEKHTLETVSVRDDNNAEPPQKKRNFNDVPEFVIGPHTGAIRKSLRKSSITENAIQHAGSEIAAIGISAHRNYENSCKLRESLEHEKAVGQDNLDFDYSLCTQNFNVRLIDEMVSTPIRSKRLEQEQIINPEAPQPQQSHKLSVIMETTEGSGHTASTKSSTQFSSPSDDEATSKPSNFMNRTKFVTENDDSDGNSSGSSVQNSKSDEIQDEVEENVKKVCNEKSFAFPFKVYEDPVQISVPVNVSHQHFKSNIPAVCCDDESMPAIQFSVNLTNSKFINETMEKQSRRSGTEIVSGIEKNKRIIEKEPVEPYPFPIFEDAPSMTTASNHQLNTPARQIDRLLDLFGTTLNSSLKDSPSEDPDTINDLSIMKLPASIIPVVVTNSNTPDCVNRSEPNLRSCPSRLELPSIHIKEEPEQPNLRSCPSRLELPSIHIKEEPEQPNLRSCPSRLELPSIHIKEEPEQSVIIVSSNESSPENLDDHQQSFVIPKIAEIQSLAVDKENDKLSIPDTKRSLCEKEMSNEFKLSISFSIEELKSNKVNDAVTSSEDPKSSLGTTFEVNDPIAVANHTGEDYLEILEIVDTDEAINCDQSIYFKQNSICMEPSWRDANDLIEENNAYKFLPVNFEESKIIIDKKLANDFVDPFDLELRQALLDEVDIVSFIQKTDMCQLVNKVPPLSVKSTFKLNNMQFDVVNAIGQGAYGRVFSVKSKKDGRMYAAKKEIPANLWEYYICTELHCRLASERISHGYMNINYGLIGNNGSILFSEYSTYGTLLDVCNRVFSSSQKHVNESIVFILAYQLLDIIDHLHGSHILHLDLKPDNFLIMRKLSSNHRDLFIQLIDFGNAVDLNLFTKEQKFIATVQTKNFICIEMMEQRPWIYQPDLFCLAGTVHSVLFGRYMEVERKSSGNYQIKAKIKRYFNQSIWEKFFKQLINIKSCESRPDLQEMKEMFLVVIENDRNLLEKIKMFNTYIESK